MRHHPASPTNAESLVSRKVLHGPKRKLENFNTRKNGNISSMLGWARISNIFLTTKLVLKIIKVVDRHGSAIVHVNFKHGIEDTVCFGFRCQKNSLRKIWVV